MKRSPFLFIIITTCTLLSCGVVERGTIPWEEGTARPLPEKSISETSANPERNGGPVMASFSAYEPGDSPEIRERKSSLKAAYNDWKGVPYRLGGYSFKGVDCSAFMQIVYRDYLSSDLPRTTEEQLDHGRSVPKDRLRTGDMVFFKTGRRTLHVGVMVNEQEFMHASTSSGVMISGLQERYWQEVYLGARRVL